MALITATQAGLWSVTATWAGGAVPADDDSVTIPPGISVQMDVDQTAFVGLRTVTVEGSASTPGMLFWKDGASGILKIRSTYHMTGSAGANRGRVVANSDGVYGNTGALAFATKAIILLEGTSQINAANLEFQQFPANPVKQFVTPYGTKATVTASESTFSGATLANTTRVEFISSGSVPAPLSADYLYYVVNTSGATFQVAATSGGTPITLTNTGSGTIEVYTGVGSGVTALNVLEDVTADTPWTDAAGHNTCILANEGPQDYDQQRTTISTIAAGVITIAVATDSVQSPGAKLILTSRNVEIRSAGTVAAQPIINAATSGVFGSVRNTAGSGTTFYGFGFGTCTNCNPSGPVSGCSQGFSACTNCNPSGPVSGCYYAFASCTNCNPSGPVSGCSQGFGTCTNCNPSGPVSGCSQGFGFCTNCNPSGPVSGGTYGFSYCTNCNPSGPVSGCSQGFSACTNCNPSGPVSGCSQGFASCTNCNPSGPVSGNAIDVNFTRTSHIVQRNKATVLTFNNRNLQGNVSRITYEDYLKVPGAQKVIDNFGDITRVTLGAGAPIPASGPGGVAGSCLECSAIQTFCGTSLGLDVIRGARFKVSAGSRTLTFKTINTFTGGIPIGGLKLSVDYIDINGDPARVNVNSGALSTATDWSQVIAASFTCLAGWVTVTLSLWDYDASVPLLYVWPVPVIA